MLINKKNIISLLINHYEDCSFEKSEITPEEIKLVQEITEIIDNYNVSASFIESKSELFETSNFDRPLTRQFLEDIYKSKLNCEICDVDLESTEDFLLESSQEESQSSYAPSESNDRDIIPFDYKKRTVEYWTSAKKTVKNPKGLYPFSTVKKHFSRCKYRQYLYKWKSQVEKLGSRLDKLKILYERVYEIFSEAKEQYLQVHDVDLQVWAIETSEDIGLKNFCASSFWLWRFKNYYNIGSRKVTSFVTLKSVKKEEETREAAREFVKEVKEEMKTVGADNTYNTDQSGFNLEMTSGRTLTTRGAKRVQGAVQSVSATRHSYTIQPVISADGKLLPKMGVVLKEQTGEFGPRVKQTMHKPDNLVLMASKSGKCHKYHTGVFYSKVYAPFIGNKTMLLEDSYSGHLDASLFEESMPKNKSSKLKLIPRGCTGFIQPEDVFLFRPWKAFARGFTQRAILRRVTVIFSQRNEIIDLQSLILDQFQSPRYRNMILYAWYASGYLDERPAEFQTPAQYSFKFNGEKCDLCNKFMFVRCGWCTRPLCFHHFYECLHMCHDYRE